MRDLRPFILVVLFAALAAAVTYWYGYERGEDEGREAQQREIEDEIERLHDGDEVYVSEPEPNE